MKWIETENRAWVNSDHIESLHITSKNSKMLIMACTHSQSEYTIATYTTEAQARECINSLISQIADSKTYTIRATVNEN